MRKDEPNVGISRGRAIEENARDGARRIGPEFDQRRPQLRLQVFAALRLDRMQKHHGLAPVELAHDRIERGIAARVADHAAAAATVSTMIKASSQPNRLRIDQL